MRRRTSLYWVLIALNLTYGNGFVQAYSEVQR